MSRRTTITFTFLSVVLVLGLVVLGRGTFPHLFGSLLVVPATVLICLVLGLLRMSTTAAAERESLGRGLIAVVVVAGNCLLSYPAGVGLSRSDIRNAKAFCDRLRPEIERHHQMHGRYPTRLPEAWTRGVMPRLLKNQDFYSANEKGYRFSIPDPTRIFAGYEFDVQAGEWRYWD